MKTINLETNQCIDNHEVIIEFLNNQSYLTDNMRVELTTGLGKFTYQRVGGCWYKK